MSEYWDAIVRLALELGRGSGRGISVAADVVLDVADEIERLRADEAAECARADRLLATVIALEEVEGRADNLIRLLRDERERAEAAERGLRVLAEAAVGGAEARRTAMRRAREAGDGRAVPTLPAAIVQVFIDGHARFHAFEERGDAVDFCLTADRGHSPVLFAIDGPVEWHPAAAGPAATPVDRPALRCRVCGCSEWEERGGGGEVPS